MVLQHSEPGRHPTGGGGKDLPACVGPRRRDEGFATRSPRPSPRPQMSLNGGRPRSVDTVEAFCRGIGRGLWLVPVRTSAAASGSEVGLVLRRALQRAGEELGLSAQETARANGRSRTFFEQARAQSRVDRHTQQMIALVLRLHRSLSALVGDDTELMRHGIGTANRHTGGIPRQQLQDPEQLVELVQYLDAMRGRP